MIFLLRTLQIGYHRHCFTGEVVMRFCVLICSLVTISTGPAMAACPIGSYPWQDAWGNPTCKRHDDGGTSTIQGNRGNAGGCPIGSYPWVDSWGNKICQTHQAPNQPQQQYYDTSRGCPVGTYAWRDNWGNPTCKRF
jgi:hypothetical protein